MSDLIDRQVAIDELEGRIKVNGYSNVALVSELNRCIGYIMRLPSAQLEPQWIPCSERLPEHYWDVLVTVKEKYEDEEEYRYHTDIAEHLEDDDWITTNDWDEGQEVIITAWMPLPEPWKGDNDD